MRYFYMNRLSGFPKEVSKTKVDIGEKKMDIDEERY